MDPAILSAVSALAGSAIGAVSSLGGSWLTLRGQLRAQEIGREAEKLEALYEEFIIEASKRLTDAMSHQAEIPAVITGLYSVMGRMRLKSSSGVMRAAEQVVRRVAEAYADPSKTFEDAKKILQHGGEVDPLKGFAEACQAELRALRV